jgi:hypothetical protein
VDHGKMGGSGEDRVSLFCKDLDDGFESVEENIAGFVASRGEEKSGVLDVEGDSGEKTECTFDEGWDVFVVVDVVGEHRDLLGVLVCYGKKPFVSTKKRTNSVKN